MKRKVLLLFVMFMCSVGTWAYSVSKDYGDGKTVDFSDGTTGVQQLTVGAGGLAEWFNDATLDKSYLNSTERTKLVITGTLNADDVAAIKTYFTKFTTVDMEGVTLEEGASVNGMQLPNAEYIALPHGTPIADMKVLNSTCPKLKAVAATDAASPTAFTGYSWAAGEIYNICQTGLVDGISSGACTNTMQKLTIGGNVDDRDASTLAANSNITNENYSFSTGAGAQYYLNGEQKVAATDYIAPSHSGNGNSPWVGGTEIELDFTEALFANKGDLALISANATELLLPTDPSFTKINNYMFANLPKLRHIIVPNNIVTIGDGAFYCNGGTYLTEEISIGNGIKTIGNAAFAASGETGRSLLGDIRFEPGISDVKILSSVFMGCKAIKHMMLPEGIVSLGERCFNQLLELESVHFPTTLEYIGRDCFRQTGLTMLTIPKSVKVIDYNAFSLCRITDIFLMAENINQLPYIYAMNFDYTTSQGDGTSSTFDSNMLNGNNTTAPVSQKNDFLGKDSQGGEELFRLSVSGGNTITKLHYDEKLKDFIDLNPWYFEGQTTPKPNSDALTGEGGNGGINETKYLSDTYYLKDNENTTYPAADAWDLARPTWAAYFSSESHAWDANGNNTDYPKTAGTQAAYYNPATGVLSAVTEDTEHIFKVLRKEGWRQFTFKAGDAASEDITFHKQYDNVWYTMCFPFSLTDEQLESAFNAEYNIADFSGVEIVTDENKPENKSLVIHFSKIAKAKYYDQDHNEYQRVEGSKVVTIAPNGAKFNTYTYTRDGKTYTYTATFSNKSYKTEGDDEIYYIDGYLAQAGRPYMIHPNLGTTEGQPSTMTHMVGINYYSRDAQVIDQLCKDLARSVDLGTGKGYEGVTYSNVDLSDIAVNTDKELTENIDQKTYSGYGGQTYTFIGNCNEYDADAPAAPTIGNGLQAEPNIEDYVSPEYLPNGPVKAVKGDEPSADEVAARVGARQTAADEPVEPTQGANPADDTSTYPSNMQDFYNTTYDNGKVLGEEILNWSFSNIANGPYSWGSTVYQLNINYDAAKAAFKAYFDPNNTCNNPGAIEITLFDETKFNALKEKCQSFYTALESYNNFDEIHAAWETNHQAWQDNIDAWNAYDAAYTAWVNYNEEQAETDYQAALAIYTSQVGNYNNALNGVLEANAAAIADWRASLASHAVLIPTNAYFLSRKSTEYYTHFFREIAPMTGREAGHGLWTRYSAVLVPNEAALAGIEAGVETGQASGAKAVEMLFDEAYSQYYDATAIEEIVEDAKEKGQKVEFLNVVVSIDGKVVRRGDTSLQGLPSGLYIVNGKKYFVK
ncbi:MAG: leucine-rich repeat domain-containing protein [Prevotellaceae bacterium]|nr:leucine-rich repeat domain-containing protein [Prevotellaceae bacterium]